MASTYRSQPETWATGGAVTQEGKLPIYVHAACGQEVVWATSSRTGRKYLVNISRGYLDQRYYNKRNAHHCPEE